MGKCRFLCTFSPACFDMGWGEGDFPKLWWVFGSPCERSHGIQLGDPFFLGEGWGFLQCPSEFHPEFLSASPTSLSWIPFPSASPLCSHAELHGNKISTTICGFLLEFSENCLYFLARGLFGEAFLICMPSSCSSVKLMHKTQHVFVPKQERGEETFQGNSSHQRWEISEQLQTLRHIILPWQDKEIHKAYMKIQFWKFSVVFWKWKAGKGGFPGWKVSSPTYSCVVTHLLSWNHGFETVEGECGWVSGF